MKTETTAAAEPVEQDSIYSQIKKLVQRKGGGPIASKTVNGVLYTFTGSPFDEPHDDSQALGYVAVKSSHSRTLVDIARVAVYRAPWDGATSMGFEVNTVDDNTRNQIEQREILIKHPQSMAHVLVEVIEYVAKHVQAKHEATAATEQPATKEPLILVHRYLSRNARGKFKTPKYREPFDYVVDEGMAFLRWHGVNVVSFSVYSLDGESTPDQAALTLGLWPASTPGEHLKHVEDDVHKLYSKFSNPTRVVLALLVHALDTFNVHEFHSVRQATGAAEPQKPNPHIPLDPNAPEHFKAFVGMRDLVGKNVTKPGFPWRVKIESVYHNPSTEAQHASPRYASCKLLLKGKSEETISVTTTDFGREYKIAVGGNHLGNNGKTGMILRGSKLAGVTKPAQFLWVILAALGLDNPKHAEVPVKQARVPAAYLDEAVRGYLGAVLQYTTDDGHEEYDEDSGEGPNLDENAYIGDFDAATVEATRERMAKFLGLTYARVKDVDGLDAAIVGSTVYLTHTGTGVNFDDRLDQRDVAAELNHVADVIFPGDLDVTADRNASGQILSVHIRF